MVRRDGPGLLYVVFTGLLVLGLVPKGPALRLDEAPAPGPCRAADIPLEVVDEGLHCLDAATAAARGLRAGDRLDAGGRRVGRMRPARLRALGVRIDLGRASLDELTALPGVGPKLAARIAAGRPYPSLEALLSVRGIGPRTLSRLRPHLSTGD
jgi:hypothetical protein